MSRKELVLKGLSVSRGIGIGSPLFFASLDDEVPEFPVQNVEDEIDRYRRAVSLSRRDVEELHHCSMSNGPKEMTDILGAHLEILSDPLMTEVVEARISDLKRNSESVFAEVVNDYKGRISKAPFLKERISDITDVSRRVLSYLRPLKKRRLSLIRGKRVVLSTDLVPSDTVEIDPGRVGGLVTQTGGFTSHPAIIARARGIPYVVHIDMEQLKGEQVSRLIVDGDQGMVIINPTEATLKTYRQRKKEAAKREERVTFQPTELEMQVYANLETEKEISLLEKFGGVGVGLFRSEYLFYPLRRFPDEEEQFKVYRKLARRLKGKPLIIRIFDVGGDKGDEFSFYPYGTAQEKNPALGCRAIRFLMRHPEILDAQLRAILRASAYGNVQILLPMVADLSELRAIRKRVEELRGRRKAVPIGCMIEVPTAALSADAFAQEADFLNIGTNDLIQYLLAADRNNPLTSHLYLAPHPSLIRLIGSIAEAGAKHGTPVLLCGEAAADLSLIPLFYGMGIRGISVGTRHIPAVRGALLGWNRERLEALAREASAAVTAEELREVLNK